MTVALDHTIDNHLMEIITRTCGAEPEG